jgi:UDP-glucose 4-epimerase
MKIAVTGGAGFIGKYVKEYAEKQGHDVILFDHVNGHSILESLDPLNGADKVIHLAGMLGTSELFDTAEEAVNVNVIGTLRILEWCRSNNAGYVGITMPDSSWANVYQATKLCAMRLATAWHRNFDVPVSHVRAYNAFGPGQKHGPGHPRKILPTFAWHAWRGLPIPIWGNGGQTVDLVYAGDLGRMLVDATEYGMDQVFDGGTGQSMPVWQVAYLVNTWCGQEIDNIRYYPMRPGEEVNTDIRAKGEGWETLGWQPKFDIARFEETVLSYRP